MSERDDKLQNSVLELGSEIFRLRGQVAQVLEMQEKVSKALKGLRGLLDEKGFLSIEDFDTAVDLSEVNSVGRGPTTDVLLDAGIDWRKRETH